MYPLKLPKWPPLVPKMSLSHYPYYRSLCHTIPTTEACVTPSLLQKPVSHHPYYRSLPNDGLPPRIVFQNSFSSLCCLLEWKAVEQERSADRSADVPHLAGAQAIFCHTDLTHVRRRCFRRALTRHRFSRLNVLQFPATWMTSIASVGPALVLGYANSPANLLSPSMQLSCELFQHGRHVQEHLPLILLQ